VASEDKNWRLHWMDMLWLAFLGGLAILPPMREWHKQLLLLAFALVQLGEGWLASRYPRWSWSIVVSIKILLATVLLDHTGPIGINSSYYPIYYLPIVTAAAHFEAWATLGWTLLVSAAYCSYLLPAMKEYQLTPEGVAELSLRILFFFLAALVVNRFATSSRRQTKRYQKLAAELAETNQQLAAAQAEARRSERLAALGRMSAGLAHEIRNPLAVIKGSSEMLNARLAQSDPLSAELGTYISSEVNRLSAMVSRFLDFARPLHVETHPADLKTVMERALRTVRDSWHGSPVLIEHHYQADLPNVLLDEDLCEQAFANLIRNAFEAMGDAGGSLSIEAHVARWNGRLGVELRLADTGPGVPPELREQIFNPFVTTKDTGVGLGLSIVAKIMDEHDGSVRVDDRAPGATFVLFFPAAEQAPELRAELASS
jgi:signal transduction histidine kinase